MLGPAQNTHAHRLPWGGDSTARIRRQDRAWRDEGRGSEKLEVQPCSASLCPSLSLLFSKRASQAP